MSHSISGRVSIVRMARRNTEVSLAGVDNMSAVTKISNLSNATDRVETESVVEDETDGNNVLATMHSLKKLLFLKIILVDVGISLGDVVTDLLQGLSLIFDEDWNISSSSNYGVLVLVTCWLPGPVTLLHFCSTRYHTVVKHQHSLHLMISCLLLLLFFPVIPSLLYLALLLKKQRSSSSRDLLAYSEFHQAADEVKAITGVTESPLQMVVMGLLMLKGVIVFPWNREISSSCIQDDLGRKVSSC